jgi:hypothetical protein
MGIGASEAAGCGSETKIQSFQTASIESIDVRAHSKGPVRFTNLMTGAIADVPHSAVVTICGIGSVP